MRIFLAALLATLVVGNGSATETYKYQVGTAGTLKMWTVDFDNAVNTYSLAEAVQRWEEKNPDQTLALCKREWVGTTKHSNVFVTTVRHSCQVFRK